MTEQGHPDQQEVYMTYQFETEKVIVTVKYNQLPTAKDLEEVCARFLRKVEEKKNGNVHRRVV